MEQIRHLQLGKTLFIIASLIIAIHPILWLINTWRDPSYGSTGYIFFALAMLLVLLSILSGRPIGQSNKGVAPLYFMLLAGFTRFLSQILAINFLGGVALCLDVYAVLKLLNLQARPRAISPFWIGVLFFLSLPIERLLQRFGGLILQDVSAAGACKILSVFFTDLECAGTLLTVKGHEILVDLPCSGTTSLMVTMASLATLCALYRPRPTSALLWAGICIALSVILNSLRISFLSIGIVYRDALAVDVMSDPAHGTIGLFTLALSLVPLFLWFRPKPWSGASRWKISAFSLPEGYQIALGALALFLAFAIITAPRTALDISAAVQTPKLPARLQDHQIQHHTLSPLEQTYFETYGGVAYKASYGPMGVTVVRTTSPLRHLHSPEECLKGLGFDVSFFGTSNQAWPSSVYKASSEQGDWNVRVTFVASDGFTSANLSAVIWHWVRSPSLVWTSYQRITPQNLPNETRHQLDNAFMAALDVPQNLDPQGERL